MLFVLIAQLLTLISAFLEPGEKIRGVNLGGWLVIEPFIRPSLFEQFLNQSFEKKAQDEFTLNKVLGKEEAQRQLNKHWSEWYSEKDFKQISNAGLNLIRIPFGWWHLGDSDEFATGLQYLDRAIEWANQYQISVLLDLHGVPGSQNGYASSGLQCASYSLQGTCACPCPKDPVWPRDESDKQYAISILTRIAQRYKSQPCIWGIQPLNEPQLSVTTEDVKDYYLKAYQALKEIVPNWKFTMHDAFRYNVWSDFMQDRTQFPNVILDTHIYQAFDQEIMKATDESFIFKDACNKAQRVVFMNHELPTIVGEFSLAIDDCARWLNGFDKPSQKEDSLHMKCNLPKPLSFWVNLAKSQIWSYEQGQGWIFWTWKTEQEHQWSYSHSLSNNWLPQNAKNIPNWIKDSPCN